MSGFDLSGFLASFFDEAKERLASINHGLVSFESGSLDDEGLVALRRDAHTIKGSALMLGVKDIGGVAHLFEDAMEQQIKDPSLRTRLMLQFLFDLHDQLHHRLDDPDGKDQLDSASLRTRYTQLLADIAAGKGGDASPQMKEEPAPLDEIESAAVQPAPSTAAVTSGLIGADEAQQWRTARREQVEAVEKQTDQKTSVEIAEGAVSATATAPSRSVAESSLYRPDVSQIELKATQRAGSGRFLRVDAERLSNLSNQVVELSTEKARNESSEQRFRRLYQELQMLSRNIQDLQLNHFRLSNDERETVLSNINNRMEHQLRVAKRFVDDLRFDRNRNAIMLDDLRDQVLGLMLRPLESIFSTFPRAVRDISVRNNKLVKLLLAGSSVEMDQGVAEALVEPLVHLLNNSIAHGIETPDERRRAGKPEEGQITIVAAQSGNEVRIEVIDDGKGIDPEVIKKHAVARNVTTQLEADQMDSAELLELIFRPGFSTYENVNEFAGRGIGMNVVQDTVKKLTGSIRIHTEVGQGTRFVLTLPVSIAVQHALLFRIGSLRLGMLTHMIEQAVLLDAGNIEKGPGGKDFVRYNNILVPMVDLRRMFDQGEESLRSEKPMLVIAEHIEGFVAIVIDELLDETEVVVRDLDPYLKRYHAQGLMGNTVIGDGSILLLIEPHGIKEMGRTAPDMNVVIEQLAETGSNKMRVLLAEDSIIAREIERSMLVSIGFEVDTAIDGLDAMEKLQRQDYDVLVTDLEMPRLDGFTLTRQLRNLERFQDIPILVISTRESPEDRMRALEAGADAYLVKQQLNQERIVDTIQTLVGPLNLKPTTNAAPIV